MLVQSSNMKNIILSVFSVIFFACTTIPWDKSDPEILNVYISVPEQPESMSTVNISSNPLLTKIQKSYFETLLIGEFTIQYAEEEPINLSLNSKLAESSGELQWRDIVWSGYPINIKYPGNGIWGNDGVPSLLLFSIEDEFELHINMMNSMAPNIIIQLEALKVKLLADKSQEFQINDRNMNKIASLKGSKLSIFVSLSKDQLKKVILLSTMTRIQQLIAHRIN